MRRLLGKPISGVIWRLKVSDLTSGLLPIHINLHMIIKYKVTNGEAQGRIEVQESRLCSLGG